MNPGEAKKQLLWAKMGSSEVWCNLLYSHTRHLWVPHFILMELVPLRDRINRHLSEGGQVLGDSGNATENPDRGSFILGKNIPGRGDHVGQAWR